VKVKIICFSIFIIVLYASLLPQTIDQKIDQLEKRLSTVTGVDKVRVLLNLAETYRYKDLTRVVQYAHQALKLCRDMKILKNIYLPDTFFDTFFFFK